MGNQAPSGFTGPPGPGSIPTPTPTLHTARGTYVTADAPVRQRGRAVTWLGAVPWVPQAAPGAGPQLCSLPLAIVLFLGYVNALLHLPSSLEGPRNQP